MDLDTREQSIYSQLDPDAQSKLKAEFQNTALWKNIKTFAMIALGAVIVAVAIF